MTSLSTARCEYECTEQSYLHRTVDWCVATTSNSTSDLLETSEISNITAVPDEQHSYATPLSQRAIDVLQQHCVATSPNLTFNCIVFSQRGACVKRCMS